MWVSGTVGSVLPPWKARVSAAIVKTTTESRDRSASQALDGVDVV
jgi:hypothetical protein